MLRTILATSFIAVFAFGVVLAQNPAPQPPEAAATAQEPETPKASPGSGSEDPMEDSDKRKDGTSNPEDSGPGRESEKESPNVAPPKRTPQELRNLALSLVRQLNAFALAERNAAEKELIELGPEILPYLPRTSSRTPAEVRQRLARVVQAIETSAAKIAVEPTYVNLKGELPLGDVFAEFQKQTGNQVIGYEDLTTSVEVAYDRATYWQAIDDLLDKAGLSVNSISQESGFLTVMPRPEGQVARSSNATYSGLFRFEPIRIQAFREIVNPTIEATRLTLGISWEPRITPISIAQPFDQVIATDENGDPVEMEAEGQQIVEVQPGMTSVDLELPFVSPQRGVKKIASLKGELQAMLPGRVERFEFTRLENASNEDQRRAGVTVTLERVRKVDALYKLWVRVRFDEASNALESYRGWIFRNQAYLLSPKGERIVPASFETTLQTDDEIGIGYYFDREEGLDGCRFRYETPALIIRMPVKYEIKDIALP